ncbi:MAG: M23 family metallopeptidase [Desulfobacteraceae bacterium]
MGRFGFSYELQIPDLKAWIFCPGMLFNTFDKWWGGEGYRKNAHEGLDLLLYTTRQGRMDRLHEGTGIQVMAHGLIVSIIKDFLGKTVFVEHASPHQDCTRVYSIYGHTVPHRDVHAGMTVHRGDIIATVAGPGSSPFPMAPHLHLSIARAPRPLSPHQFSWETLGTSHRLTLLDPLKVLHHPYRILAHRNPICRNLMVATVPCT